MVRPGVHLGPRQRTEVRVQLRSACRVDELPVHCRRYVTAVEEMVGVPVELVSIGAGRDQTIVRGDLFTR